MWLTHLDGIWVEMRSVQFRVAGDAKHAERGADFVLQDFQRTDQGPRTTSGRAAPT